MEQQRLGLLGPIPTSIVVVQTKYQSVAVVFSHPNQSQKIELNILEH